MNKNNSWIFNGRNIRQAEATAQLNPEKRVNALITRKYLEQQLLQAQEEGNRAKVEALQQKLRMIGDVQTQDQMAKAMQEEEDFSKWLLGRGREEDHIRTPWYRTPITNVVEGARQFIQVKLKAREEFLQRIAELKGKRVPSNIKEAYSYWKYIVKGMDGGELAFMEEWTGIRDHEKDVMAYGRKVADQLDGWWQKKGPIMPDGDVKLMETDFDAYMKVLFNLDPTDRQRLGRKLQLRQETLEQLALNQHHGSIRELLLKYQDESMEYDEAILYNTGAYEKLDQEDKRLAALIPALARNPILRNNNALRDEIKRQLLEVRSRKVAVMDNMVQTIKKAADEPEKLQELRRLIAERTERRQVPPEIWDLVHGQGDMLAVHRELTDRWNDLMDEGQRLLEGAISFDQRWIHPDGLRVMDAVKELMMRFARELRELSDTNLNI